MGKLLPKKLYAILIVWMILQAIYVLVLLGFGILSAISIIKDQVFEYYWPAVVFYIILGVLVLAVFIYMFRLLTGKTKKLTLWYIWNSINLLFFPFGTILAIVTFIILQDVQVKRYLAR